MTALVITCRRAELQRQARGRGGGEGRETAGDTGEADRYVRGTTRRLRGRGMRIGDWLAAAVLGATPALAAPPAPVIDMHLHALQAADQGPPPVTICAPYDDMPVRDPRWDAGRYFAETFGKARCRHPLVSAPDDDTLRARSLAYLERYNITAVTSGAADMVEAWRRAAPARIIPALMFAGADLPPIARLRELHAAGRLAVLGEIGTQYDGIAADDPKLEPYYALAEELDIPVAIHMGPGPPGAPYLGMRYRMRLTDPLSLEEVLVRHPRLRLYVMHAGWPMADRMIALMYAHPQVYVDTGVIDYTSRAPSSGRFSGGWSTRATASG